MIKKRYNVIMITIDGARIDRIRKFKNFNKLINQGVFFSQVIAYAPYTIAGLHSIFSGTYGNKTGVDNYYGSYSFKKNFYKTITQYMKDKDYYTIGDIINELVVPKEGFDELKIHDEYKDNLTDRHSELLRKVAKLKKEKKNFFLYLHYSNIHTKIKINVSRKYTNYSKEYFDNKEENLKSYDSYLQKADEYLEVIFNKIKEWELNDSIIIVHSDHGISVGEKFGERTYGAFCYDYTAKAFTLFIQPRIFPIKEIKQLVRTIDTVPTIIDILGFAEDKNYKKMDGKTMMPLIKGEIDERYGFIEAGNPLKTGAPPRQPNIRAIRTSKWKFIHNYWDDSEELYDIENDPDEEDNIIKTNKKVADKLREKLNQELIQ